MTRMKEFAKPFRLKVEKALQYCAPEGSRTPNLLIRSQVLYPIKLQVHFLTDCKNMLSFQTNISFLKIVAIYLNQHIKRTFLLVKCLANRIKIRKIACRL